MEIVMCVEQWYGRESVAYQSILRLLMRFLCLGEVFAVLVLIGLLWLDDNVLRLCGGVGSSGGRSGCSYVCHGEAVCETLADAQVEGDAESGKRHPGRNF
jgi:hypothetical protein